MPDADQKNLTRRRNLNLSSFLDDFRLKRPSLSIKEPSGLYPSQASCVIGGWGNGLQKVVGSCLRQVFYSRTGADITNPIDVLSMKKFALGDATHEIIVEDAKAAGIYVADEVDFTMRVSAPLSGTFKVSGRIDLVIRNPEDGLLEGREIKSIQGYWGTKGKIFAKGETKLAPGLDHVCQIVPYIVRFEEKISRWGIFYVDRGSACDADHDVFLDDEGFAIANGVKTPISRDGVFQRFDQAQAAIAANEVPDRDFQINYDDETIKELADSGELSKTDLAKLKKGFKLEKGDWQCRYCQWRNHCWGELADGIDREGEVEEP